MKFSLSRALSAGVAVLVLAVAGCTDTTVEPKSTITDANIFNDQTSYKAFIAKLYAGLAVTGQRGPDGNSDIATGDEGFSQYLRLWWELQELPTDEAIIAWNDLGIPEMNFMTWAETNNYVTQMYYRIFYQVALANEFLRQTTDDKLSSRGASTSTQADVKTYRAEARFLRALSYWHALDLYGNVPLVTEENPVGAEPPQQNTRVELFDFVASELNAIKADLPTANTYGRATAAAANMVLAHLYLNSAIYTGTARYDLARQSAEAVINGGFTLASNWRLNFVANNNTSPEIVFAIPQDGTKTQTWGGMTFLLHAGCGGNNVDANSLGLNGCWWGIRLRPQAWRLFEAGDGRAAIFVNNQAPAKTFAEAAEISNWQTFDQGIAAPKYSNRTLAGAAGSHNNFPDTDFPMFRLADAYLIYAEAVARGGGGSQATALGYVNALRRRAFGDTNHDWVAADLTALKILDERGRELLWEAHRRSDLVRNDRFAGAAYIWTYKGGTPAGAATPTYLNLYPIPQNELVANPNLTQNTGY
jgi:hypothetical protein